MYFNLYENFLKSKIFGLLKSISHPSKVFGRKKLLFQFGSRTSFSNAEKMQNQISFKVEKSHIKRSGWNTDFVGKRKKVVKQAVTSKSYVCFLFACAKKNPGYLIEEMQISLRKVMPWLDDVSQKVMGSNPRIFSQETIVPVHL